MFAAIILKFNIFIYLPDESTVQMFCKESDHHRVFIT